MVAADAAISSADTPTRHLRAWLVGGGLLLCLMCITVAHLSLGAAGIGAGDIAEFLRGQGDSRTGEVLLGSRLPRTLTGLVVGAALGIAGALIQGATRNPLAAPDTLGVNAGAYLAVVLVAFFGLDLGPIPAGGAAFIGGLLAVSVVYLLTSGSVLTPGRVLLAGATVAMAATAGAEFMQILDTEKTRGLFFWGSGTLLQSGIQRPLVLGAVVVLFALVAPLFARPLDLVALGDETAEAMGVKVRAIRLGAFVLAVVLSAAAVTLAGPIGFVGLIAPVMVRQLGIRSHAALIPLAALMAAVVILGADVAAQTVVTPSAAQPTEIPVGVVTALIGGPVFMAMARRVTTGDADLGAAVAVSGRRRAPSYGAALVVGVVVLFLVMLVSLRVGDVDVTWGQIFSSLFGSAGEITEAVVSHRLPRILVAAVAGACLAIAGVAVQAVVRNPLAEPGLIGVTGGSALGAVSIILVAPAAPAVALPVAAGVGGVTVLAVVLLVAQGSRAGGRSGLDPTRVVLVGLGAGATSMALVNMMVVGAQMNIAAALTWLVGSTYGRDASTLALLVVPALAGVLLVVFARPVNLLALGDETPRALGLDLGKARLMVLGAGAVLAAGAVAAVGAVGFVGLLAPHLARRLIGNNTAHVAPMAALLGAILVVLSDALGRWLLAPIEIPVGVVTALVGAPYLVWLLRRSQNL